MRSFPTSWPCVTSLGAVLLVGGVADVRAQIQVLSPNGEEIWQAGTTQTIQWVTIDTPGDVLVYATNLTTGDAIEVGHVPACAEAINWRICPLFGDGPCIVTVTSLGPEGWEDSSDLPFTIAGSSENLPILVANPNGGENFSAGSTHLITWTGGGPGQIVQADLLKGSDWMYAIGTAPVEAGALTWDVCPDLPEGGDYIIDLRTSGCGASSEDVSDLAFSITASAAPPTLAITSPNGGELFPTGAVRTVTWVGTGLEGDAQISLVNATTTIYLGAAPAAGGSFTWPICSLLPSGQDYRIRIRADGCWMSVEDESDAVFSIAGGGGGLWPTLDLLYPQGGETWVAGTSQTVNWSTSDPTGDVRVVLYDGKRNVIDVLVPLAAGSYHMDLPGNLTPGMTYQVLMFWFGCGPELYDASTRFFVVAPGDLDGDGDVDPDDGTSFRACMTGPSVLLLDASCQVADLDQDDDVDAADFGLLQRCFSGAGQSPRPDCLR